MIISKRIFQFFIVAFIGFVVSCGSKRSIEHEPDKNDFIIGLDPKIEITDSLFFKGKSSLRKNTFGQWELVASGNPMDLGNTIGDLSAALVQKQEALFFSKIEELVPSNFSRYFLRKFLAWYTRKMYIYVKEEYKDEIYGISHFLSDKYDYLADQYQRSLYLHAAHDIGHALQDLALVAVLLCCLG